MALKQTVLKVAFGFVTTLRKAYWRAFKPVTIGVKVIAVHDDKILLVKTRYHDHWYLPGGGVKKGENPYEAVRRELREECALELTSLSLLAVYSSFQEGKNDHIVLFGGTIKDSSTLRPGLEIENCGLVEPSQLPEKTSPATIKRLQEYAQNALAGGQW